MHLWLGQMQSSTVYRTGTEQNTKDVASDSVTRAYTCAALKTSRKQQQEGERVRPGRQCVSSTGRTLCGLTATR